MQREGSQDRRTQVQRRADARDRLLVACAELIAEGGLGAVTLAVVGARAGYSRGIANHHFGTKSALIEELIDRVEHEFHAATDVVERVDNSIDAIVETATIFLGLLEDLPTLHRAFLVLWAAAVASDELRPRMAASDRAFRRQLTRVIERGQHRDEIDQSIQPSSISVALLGQLRGIALQHLLAPESIDLVAARLAVETSVRQALSNVD